VRHNPKLLVSGNTKSSKVPETTKAKQGEGLLRDPNWESVIWKEKKNLSKKNNVRAEKVDLQGE